MSETIADIKAWLRRPIEGENAYLTLWRNEIADRIEAAENQSVTDCNRLGNAARMRAALINAYYAMFKFIKTPYYEYEEMSIALDAAKAALDEPPRNCDRPECATTKAAQEVWRKEDGGKTAYYEWLLETSTAKGGSK